ncbi:hypothetical protein [Dyella sp. 2RAB6]|uniref:hypothetical protein n=1 Tax=Dyella sp. 2RAB6 TaxID=3232992 RepID=UPI003F932D07
MSTLGEPWLTRHTHYYADPEATATDLLNDATEWLQYARHTTALLAELIDDADSVDESHLAVTMGGVSALVELGMRCAIQAHGKLLWQQSQTETVEDSCNT